MQSFKMNKNGFSLMFVAAIKTKITQAFNFFCTDFSFQIFVSNYSAKLSVQKQLRKYMNNFVGHCRTDSKTLNKNIILYKMGQTNMKENIFERFSLF